MGSKHDYVPRLQILKPLLEIYGDAVYQIQLRWAERYRV